MKILKIVKFELCFIKIKTVLKQGSDMTKTAFYFSFFKRFYLFSFRQKEERKRGKETSVCGCLLHTPLMGDLACNPGTWLQTGNPTGDYLVCRPVLSPLSHANQGHNCLLELNLVAPLASRSQ